MSSLPAVAAGRLGMDGPWVGFAEGASGHHLVFGSADGELRGSRARGERRVAELLAVLIAYYEEALDPAPPELEATQADLAALLLALAESEPDRGREVLLREALDAIDDGLPGDAVVARLGEARRSRSDRQTDEQADVVDLLVTRFRALGGENAAG